jgi:hypothetical protein
MAAFALNFWQGTPEENARMEAILVKLAGDDGHGEEILDRVREEEKRRHGDTTGEEHLTRVKGLRIRYNATAALARRGSPKTRLDVLDEMLDPKLQQENFRIRRQSGEVVADEATANTTVEAALQAIVELHLRDPKRDLKSLLPALDALTGSANYSLRNEAERTRKALSGM